MALWEHLACGTIFDAKVPPLDCDVCAGSPLETGWMHRGPSPNRLVPRRRRRNKKDIPRHRRSLIRRYGEECRHCGTTENLTIDHIQPISKGGSNRLENLQLLCESCNQAKGDKWDPAP